MLAALNRFLEWQGMGDLKVRLLRIQKRIFSEVKQELTRDEYRRMLKAAEAAAFVVTPKAYETRDAFNEALLETIKACKPDLIVLAGFLVKIPAAMIEAYRNKIINIHPSLIPSFCGVGYYGLKVHEAALARGVKVTGATVHYVDEGTDTGPILFQKAVEVQPDDTPKTLQQRVMEQAEWVLLPQAINAIANGRI